MKWFLELGNRYAKQSSWVDFALVKFCLFAMGLLVGTLLSDECKKWAIILAAVIFAATYLPLMAKVFRIAKEMKP